MFNKINEVRPYSMNNNQDFMWISENLNAVIKSEFDLNDEANSFSDIDKRSLMNFGLIGCGHKMFYEIPTGRFNINGDIIDIIYKADDKEYNLTNQFVLYNDVIQFKECCSDFNIIADRESHKTHTIVTSYNFGYKVKLNIDEKIFSFKAVCTIPYDKSAYINFRLVCNEDIDGVLVIKKNGFCIAEFQAPLKENYSGEVNWIIK
ncbi:hypothetical protein [Clostridium tagluense]|uniref:Uncharacterized protein n=1 Tax=Clostridium tagluense TaxID=360422 RepID=A0A401UQI9_9CLOT|nr:hypothetical protein [Clostridium tagluense]GCD11786.1 hypothetical protein Ctaglu_34090 [Clostridium tagluense]